MPRSVVFLSLCACLPIHALRVGTPALPLADDCAVHQVMLAVADADARYQQVGLMCTAGEFVFSNTKTSDDGLGLSNRDLFVQKACALGGDIVVASGFCAVDKASGTEWHVYRERPSAD